MKKTQIIAIAIVAAVLVAGGAAGYYVLKDDAEEQDRGWYSWNPKTFLTSSSNVAPSPYWTKVLEDLYETAYGDLPSYDTYTMDDIPADFLKYQSLVSKNSSGQTVIKSMYRDASKTWNSFDVTITEAPTGGFGSGSYFVCLYYLLCAKNGVKPLSYDSATVTELWSMAYGGDPALYERLELNYGIPIAEFNGEKLANPSKVSENKEVYTDLLNKLITEGKKPVWLCSGSSPSYENGGQWMRELMESKGCYSLTFRIESFPDCLAEIEAIAYAFGMGDYAKGIIDDIKLRTYTLKMAAEKKSRKRGTGRQDWEPIRRLIGPLPVAAVSRNVQYTRHRKRV